MKKNKNGIGKRISDCREDMDLTMEELATIMDVGQATINRWESNKTEPNATQIGKLSKVFNTSCDYIITGIETKDRTIYDEIGLTTESIDRLKSKQSKIFGIEAKAINLLLSPPYRGILISIYEYLFVNYREPYVMTSNGIKQVFPPTMFPPLIQEDDITVADSIGGSIDALFEGNEATKVFEEAKLLNLMIDISKAKEEVYKRAIPVRMSFDKEEKKDE